MNQIQIHEYGEKGTLDRLKEITKQAEQNLEKKAAERPRELFLPGYELGAFPNHLNRSSLFAPVRKAKNRIFHVQATMVTRSDCVLEYTGEQLDEHDCDLIMALIDFAKPYPLGIPVQLNRKNLLGKIKRGALGGAQYAWLYKAMKRLREGTMFLEARKPDGSVRYTVGKMESFNIVKDLSYDGEREIYTYVLDPRWVVLYGNREYALISWEKRMQIGRNLEMAKALQRLLATSADPVQRYGLENLKIKLAQTGRMRDFRASVERAVIELKRLEIIAEGRIMDSMRGKPQLVLWLIQAET